MMLTFINPVTFSLLHSLARAARQQGTAPSACGARLELPPLRGEAEGK